MRSTRILTMITAVVLSVAACGIPTDDSAAPIDVEQLPESLRPGITTTTTTIVDTPLTESAIVFLLESVPNTERRVVREVLRDVPRGTPLEGVLSTIFGPDVRNEEELELGYSNALFELMLLGAVVRDVADWSGGVALINIQPLTPEGAPSEEAFTGDLIGAAAQLVFSATSYEGVTGVQILINGEETPIPTTDGDVEPGTILVKENFERFNPAILDIVPTTTTVAESDG